MPDANLTPCSDPVPDASFTTIKVDLDSIDVSSTGNDGGCDLSKACCQVSINASLPAISESFTRNNSDPAADGAFGLFRDGCCAQCAAVSGAYLPGEWSKDGTDVSVSFVKQESKPGIGCELVYCQADSGNNGYYSVTVGAGISCSNGKYGISVSASILVTQANATSLSPFTIEANTGFLTVSDLTLDQLKGTHTFTVVQADMGIALHAACPDETDIGDFNITVTIG